MEFIQQNIMLVILAVASGSMLLATHFMGAAGSQVTTTEATTMINREDAQILDVRDVSEFSTGHLLGAMNIPVAKFADRAADLAKMKDKPIIVCCETGIRSSKAVKELKKLGFERVFGLDGGMAAWAKAGLPVTKKGERK